MKKPDVSLHKMFTLFHGVYIKQEVQCVCSGVCEWRGGSVSRVVILRGQILVRRSGDLIDGSIMAPIQPLALGLIAALCSVCSAISVCYASR